MENTVTSETTPLKAADDAANLIRGQKAAVILKDYSNGLDAASRATARMAAAMVTSFATITDPDRRKGPEMAFKKGLRDAHVAYCTKHKPSRFVHLNDDEVADYAKKAMTSLMSKGLSLVRFVKTCDELEGRGTRNDWSENTLTEYYARQLREARQVASNRASKARDERMAKERAEAEFEATAAATIEAATGRTASGKQVREEYEKLAAWIDNIAGLLDAGMSDRARTAVGEALKQSDALSRVLFGDVE